MVAAPIRCGDLAYVFVAAVLGGGLAWLARQALILGYVAGGLLVSPLTPGPSISDVHTFELFAEIGVVLLMFSLGIEFSLKDLMRVKWVAVLGGPLGIVLSIALGLATAAALGWSLLEGAIVGMVVSVASTMVLARLLLDRGELRSRHGRVMIGITLVEDLAVVVLIVLIPAIGGLHGGDILALGKALATAAAILVPFFFLAGRILPRLLTLVAKTRNDELFLLVALAVALGAAALTQAAGLSLALGAFLAGLLINESDYAHETLARLLPLRDAFVALFFVTVGALIDLRTIATSLPLLGALLGLVIVGKFVIWTTVTLVFGQPLWTALLVGVGLTQIGEFSFILVQVARQAGHVGADIYNATLAASLVTILINAALVKLVPMWIGRGRLAHAQAPAAGAQPGSPRPGARMGPRRAGPAGGRGRRRGDPAGARGCGHTDPPRPRAPVAAARPGARVPQPVSRRHGEPGRRRRDPRCGAAAASRGHAPWPGSRGSIPARSARSRALPRHGRRRDAREWRDGASSDRRHGPARGRPLAALRPAPEDRRAPGRIRGAQRMSETL